MSTIINIRNQSVAIDIEAELREYDFGYNARWTSDKLIASSPFRTDNAPSFFVNLSGDYAGTWADSGALDDEYARGNFVVLIAHLRGINYDEASNYLLEKYGALYEINPDEPIRIIPPKLNRRSSSSPALSSDLIVNATSPYLLSRGISAETQALYGVGYGDTSAGYTAIPWYTERGRLANIKYRSTSDKRFFYEKDATPIKRLVFGIDLAEYDTILVEGEIDAMSWREAGYAAIAIGGAHLSREQAEIIKRSGIRRLYLGGDNDAQGRKLNEQVERELRGYVEMQKIDYGAYKDASEALKNEGKESLIKMVKESHPIICFKIRNIGVI